MTERRATPFTLPTMVSTVFNRDAQFWRLHAAWRDLEDAFEASPFHGDQPEGVVMLDRATDARDAMFMQPVSTVIALQAKFEAAEEGGVSSVIDMELPNGGTVMTVIKADLERLAQQELASVG